ncbi:hypothetical protein DXG03_009607 [Asterophora parasitica]|uniref:Uncharacterized protein n=1 Tax=Asterophora parasitica TaxID=117018 RepID=A0A9P7FZP7_9AGAR|nr:hypothetical protein DXG03_009607 [Asterophora parasitica]
MCLQLEPRRGQFAEEEAEKELIWVAVQVKHNTDSKAPLDLVRKSVKSVTPSQFWLHKTNAPFAPKSHPDLQTNTDKALEDLCVFRPNFRNPADDAYDEPMNDAEFTADDAMEGVEPTAAHPPYPLLRVICCFPAEIAAKDCDKILQEDPFDSHDLAWLPFSSYESLPGAEALKRFKDANLDRQRKSEVGKAPQVPQLRSRGTLFDALSPPARGVILTEQAKLVSLEQIPSLDLKQVKLQVDCYKTIEKVLKSKNGVVRNQIKYSFGPLPRARDELQTWRDVLLKAAHSYLDKRHQI